MNRRYNTAKLTSFVVFILVGARVFSLTFYGVDGHLWVEHLLTALPGGQMLVESLGVRVEARGQRHARIGLGLIARRLRRMQGY